MKKTIRKFKKFLRYKKMSFDEAKQITEKIVNKYKLVGEERMAIEKLIADASGFNLII